jgi:CubicO group peptidase (beta-lactamase class C family)
MGDDMSKQILKIAAHSLLAVASFAVLAACAHDAPASPQLAVAAINSPDGQAWPVTAIGDPTRLGFSVEGLQALDARMKEAVDKGELAGISYALVKDGEVAALKHHGAQSLGGPAMDANTLFRIRSTGKTITAVAMMQLWEQGRWKPEDPITKFLPELANLKVATSPDNLTDVAPVSHIPTMHEVMTHTAGFGYGLFPNVAADRAFSERDVLRSKDMATLVNQVAGIPLVNQPGERWYYSITYDLQGAIIERITGKPLGDYLAENIFAPLGMDDTGFWLSEADRPHLATVYTRNPTSGALEPFRNADNSLTDDPFAKNSNFESGGGGASGLISTLHDMVRFTQMLVNKGELDGKRVLKPETVAFMTQNRIGSLKGVMGGDAYGFGYGGRVVVNGSTPTMPQPNGSFSHFSIEGAWFWIDPSNRLSFVGLIQRRGGGGPGAVPMGTDGDASRLVYQALVK